MDGGGPAGHLVEFGFCPGEADPESFDLAMPSLSFGLGDAVEQIAEDLGGGRRWAADGRGAGSAGSCARECTGSDWTARIRRGRHGAVRSGRGNYSTRRRSGYAVYRLDAGSVCL